MFRPMNSFLVTEDEDQIVDNLDFSEGLIMAIIQDQRTHVVWGVGLMNEEALVKTLQTLKVTFFNKHKNKLETIGALEAKFLVPVEILISQNQQILIKAEISEDLSQFQEVFVRQDRDKVFNYLQELEDIDTVNPEQTKIKTGQELLLASSELGFYQLTTNLSESSFKLEFLQRVVKVIDKLKKILAINKIKSNELEVFLEKKIETNS